MSNIDRRQFILRALKGAGTLGLLSPTLKAFAESCGLTPAQTQGPFFPEQPLPSDSDLTRASVRGPRAKGEVIVIRGVVQDQSCKPVKNARVEVWQAAASGKYKHSADTNPAPLDPHFKYSAELITDAQGKYEFRTIIPGSYPATETWDRPPHIHFKISCLGFQELITQMYFAEHPLNERDPIFLDLSAEERARVLVKLSKANPMDPDMAKAGEFNISIRKYQT